MNVTDYQLRVMRELANDAGSPQEVATEINSTPQAVARAFYALSRKSPCLCRAAEKEQASDGFGWDAEGNGRSALTDEGMKIVERYYA